MDYLNLILRFYFQSFSIFLRIHVRLCYPYIAKSSFAGIELFRVFTVRDLKLAAPNKII